MKRVATIAVVCCLLGVAGCQRLGIGSQRQYAAPLPATPTTPVAGGQLQPLEPLPGTVTGEPLSGQPLDGAPGTEVAAAGPLPEPTDAREIGRNDMLGGWKLASGADNCMLFMTLTTWTGGYRANTRGCSDPALAGISAWDLNGKLVVLKGAAGDQVAQLYASGGDRFSGQTATGRAISFSR
ncbi:protease inhibitor Inh/omp19 family protein [Polymorphum gilvum]|uniref:Bacterial outer membrane lipoprotein omp19 n=1 Tax=Polymorphum gilvum (strain LMG 25793 / CGMCC 1.9160 / SL003B-26A1) TaxID=991905 RepID=F2IVD7_POLGS|nr:protease inhibitor Inh/omp19 family protein [Polymorphum gilvum]ADZ72655.1 Bacterial outer membrane lipoprotein omp19 [Polymorphum gilvum SL003B-26A1]